MRSARKAFSIAKSATVVCVREGKLEDRLRVVMRKVEELSRKEREERSRKQE